MAASAVNSSGANIYASGLEVTESGVQFLLNATPTEVKVNFYNGETLVKTIVVENGRKGLNTVSLAGVFENVSANTVLNWEVMAKADSNNGWRCFSAIINGKDAVPIEQKMGYTNGVAVDNNPYNTTFGRIYMLNGSTSYNDGRQLEVGLYAYNPDLTIINDGTTAFKGGVSWTGEVNSNGICISPNALTADDSGNLYISDWSDSHAGVWLVTPDNLTGTWNPLFEIGTENGGVVKNENDEYVHGSITGICVVGSGANRVLYTVDEDYEGGAILKYNIGEMQSLPITSKATLVYKLSDNANLVGGRNSYLTPDRKGGFWFAQRSNTRTENRGYFNLLHFTKNGNLDWSIEDYFGNGTVEKALRQMAFASNLDGSVLVFGMYQCVGVKNVVFNEDGTIKSCVDGASLGLNNSQRKVSSTIMGAAFDVTNNLYVADYSDYFQSYALPKPDNSYTTRANGTVVVNETMTGVDVIGIDANAPVEYYNLQGVKVENPSNGIFIKKQGTKATKVIF